MYTNDGVRRTLEEASKWMLGGHKGPAADAYLRAAEAYARTARPQEALAVAFTALKLAPARFVALAVSGLVHCLGTRALPLCNRAVELHLHHRRTHDATALLELLVVIQPRDCEVRIQLAELYARAGRHDEGLTVEMAALELFESDGNNRDLLAVAQHMLTLDGRHRGALRTLVRAHQRLGELDRAIRAAAALLAVDSHDDVALEAVARILVHRGDASRGLEVLRQLVARLGPRDAARVLGRARRWCRREDYLHAIEDIRRSAEEIIELTGEDLLPATG